MNASTLFQSSRRWLLTLVVAAILALTAAYAPVVVDNLAGTALTPQAYACHPTGVGCG
jgi:hypothetical protein